MKRGIAIVDNDGLTVETRARSRCPGSRRRGIRGGRCTAVLVTALGSLVPGTLFGANVSLGSVTPVGGIADKQVESVRERRYAYLVEQERDFSCGAAALATVLRHAYGVEQATENRILEGLFSITDAERARRRGFSLLDLKRFVEQIGMRGRGYRVGAEALREIRVPTIVLIETGGYRHFVVLRQVADGHAYLGDPALGNRRVELGAFLDSWNGVVFAVIGKGFDEQTALLHPRDAVSAPDLSEVNTRIPRSSPISFGLRRVALF